MKDIQILPKEVELQHNKVVPSWHSAAARNKAKTLLQDVMSKTGKLTEEKKKLKEFFLQFGILSSQILLSVAK